MNWPSRWLHGGCGWKMGTLWSVKAPSGTCLH